MRNIKLAVSAAALVIGAGLPTLALAQAQESSFVRDRSVNVNQRSKEQWAALGVRTPGFFIQPSLGVDLQAQDNVFYTDADKKSDTAISLKPSVVATSTWSRHRLSVAASGDLRRFASNDSENTETFQVSGEGRLDVSRRANLFARALAGSNVEGRNVPTTQVGVVSPIEYTNSAVNVGGTIEGNRLRLIGQIGTAELNYKDARSTTGGVIDQDFRDMTMSSASLRLDYALSPNTSLYALYEMNDRKYNAGFFARGSDGYNVAVGASFDLTNLLRGEFQVGQFSQSYDNAAFGTQKSTSFLGSVEWFPTQLTTVTFKGQRSIEESAISTAYGALTSSASVTVDHELLRNLVLTGAYALVYDDYRGIDRNDNRSSLMFGGRYYVSRRVALTGSLAFETLKSDGSFARDDYDAKTVRLGVNLYY